MGESGKFKITEAKGEESFRKEMISSVWGCQEMVRNEVKKFWIWRQEHAWKKSVSKGGEKPGWKATKGGAWSD